MTGPLMPLPPHIQKVIVDEVYTLVLRPLIQKAVGELLSQPKSKTYGPERKGRKGKPRHW